MVPMFFMKPGIKYRRYVIKYTSPFWMFQSDTSGLHCLLLSQPIMFVLTLKQSDWTRIFCYMFFLLGLHIW